jgi:hypothetical protein
MHFEKQSLNAGKLTYLAKKHVANMTPHHVNMSEHPSARAAIIFDAGPMHRSPATELLGKRALAGFYT